MIGLFFIFFLNFFENISEENFEEYSILFFRKDGKGILFDLISALIKLT
jgi:hypothetical protein